MLLAAFMSDYLRMNDNLPLSLLSPGALDLTLLQQFGTDVKSKFLLYLVLLYWLHLVVSIRY